MKMKGIVRLWVVLAAVFVITISALDFRQKEQFWNAWMDSTIKTCVDIEWSKPNHPDALECGKRQGTMETVFQHEGTTPGRYWSTTLAWAFVGYLVLTLIVSGLFLIGRWVWRGFRD
jgi:hypothetical protein